MKPVIRKIGTIDLDTVETTPVVFNNRLYRFEYVRQRYRDNTTGDSYFRFIDVETGKPTPPFAASFHLGSAMVHRNRVYVFAVDKWGGDTIYQFESDDLENWSAPRPILRDPQWEAYNTSVCRGADRYIMAFELRKPVREVGEPFTTFFAESHDLREWRRCPDIPPFTPERYSACPTIRYCNGYYYMFDLEGSYETAFRHYLYRSSDLSQWLSSPYNPVLTESEEDRRANAVFTPAQLEHIANAVNINNSDIDLCEYNGKVIINYSWGNQRGVEFLAAAEADGALDDFLAAWFPDNPEGGHNHA